MQSTEAMQDEELIGRISMRVEHVVGRCDDARRSLRAEAMARWLLDEWRASRSASKEAAA
jgi:hypothetical protein